MAKKIKTIILDIGNVLVDFRWKAFIESFGYNEEIQKKVAAASVLNKDWNEYDRGVLTDEEILSLFVQNDPSIEEQLRIIFRSFDGLLKCFDYTESFIRELKEKGYRVLYLSNFSDKAYKECGKELDFLKLTDGGILSYRCKLIKPDPAIYELLKNMYSLNPAECLFFDDTEINILAAREAGYNAEVFTGYENAKRIIFECGI
ncbi:MAG: HAD family phosphatase [Lachnospiraceae bacterium]|nr:HAD family phosphatase [Lachnospiraceae bacterium]